jgi:type I restriction enzyme M protein
MNQNVFKDIEDLEKDLWEAADNLRANSKLTSSDYFMPVLGIIFLRHAANRFVASSQDIQKDKAAGRMPKRAVVDDDYVRRRALPLPERAQYDWIMTKASSGEKDLPTLVIDGMTAIEDKFAPLQAVLPKDYGIFEPKVLEDLMRLFNSEQIRQATGDLLLPRLMSGELPSLEKRLEHDHGHQQRRSAGPKDRRRPPPGRTRVGELLRLE